MRGSLRLARIAGIDLVLNWSWVLVLLVEFQARAGVYSSPIWVLGEILALFAIVTLHEFGHALACRQVGGAANRIMLWPFGGIAYVDPPQRPGAMLWTLAAGPLVNVALFAPLYFFQLAGRAALPGNPDLFIFSRAIYLINIGLFVFNILPVYPLDGGQILRALLWYPLGRARSLMVATPLGLVGVAGLFLLAARTGDWWLAAITVFILLYCWSGMKQARALWRLAKLPHHEGFACPWCAAAPVAGELWRCARCRRVYDVFAGGASCPGCGQTRENTQCVECGHVSPVAAWTRAALPHRA